MEDKKYYWLKLHRDFFKRHDVKIIEAQENGKDYIIFYLKLLTEGIDHEGELRFSDEVPYDEKMLSIITDTNIDIVRSAVSAFVQMGLMDHWSNGTYFMSKIEKMIGSESSSAPRVRRFREQKALHCNTDVTTCNKNVTQSKSKSQSKSQSLEKEGKGHLVPRTGPRPKNKIAETTEFQAFYEAYPKKRKRIEACKAWTAMKPSLPPLLELLNIIERWKQTFEWTKDDGRFIPNPATWLRAGGWSDEIPSRHESSEERRHRILGAI